MLLLRLPPDGTPVETAIDANRQQAQASKGHAHVRMYVCMDMVGSASSAPQDGDAGRVNRQ